MLYHEFYHLNNDNRSRSKLDTEITFLATPPTDIKQCIRTMMIERDHANEFSQEHQELLYYTYVNLGIYYDATYYENEVNTYRKEIAKIKDVTSVYDAERKYMLWVNETKLAKLNN